MGQGSDDADAAGYDAEYDLMEHNLTHGRWVDQAGRTVAITDMSIQQLRGALRYAQRTVSQCRVFDEDDEEDLMSGWVDALETEIDSRARIASRQQVKPKPTTPAVVRGTRVKMQCYCGTIYLTREADLNRGWGLACCKSHAAVRRDFGRPAGKRVE